MSIVSLAGMLAVLLGASTPLTVDGARAEWTQTVASLGNDWINDLVPLSNGNILGVGFVNRQGQLEPESDWAAIAVELAPNGRKVAEHRYGEGGGIDAFWSTMEGESGGRMFAGFTTRIGAGGIDALALNTSADGKLVGEFAYGGAGYDRFTDVTQAGDGFVFIGHSQLPGSELRRAFLVKTDRQGAKIWERIFDGPESWGALYVEPSGDGGFVIAGGVAAPNGDGDMFLLKTDREGRELWRKRVGTSDWDEINHGLVVRPNGTIVLVGYTHPHGSETNDLVAATLTKGGNVLRLERWGGSKDDRAILPKLDADGRVWVVGQTASAGAGGSDLLLTSLDSNGSFGGAAIIIGGPKDDHGTAVLPIDDGSLVVAGYSENLGQGGEDAFVMRLTPPAIIDNPAFERRVVTPVR